MGDIYGAIQVVLQVIAPLVSGEAALLGTLKDDINAIQNDLRSISVFLMNAEEKAERNAGARQWVQQVRMLAYDIEDAIERYQLFRNETSYSRAKKYLSFQVRRMASTIQGLRETSMGIAKSREAYGFGDHVAEGQGRGHGYFDPENRQLTMTFTCSSVDVDGYIVVEDIDAKGEIIDLLELQNLNSRPSIIAVVGMRGLGKTSVLASVFYDKTIGSYFPARAWIRLSQPNNTGDILRSMVLKFIPEPTNEFLSMDNRSLRELLRSFLKDKRYIIVFDDAQEHDTKLIYLLKRTLPYNDRGSKILMATRYNNVANAWLDGSVNGMYKLKPLPSEKAWKLFCKKTFQSYGGGGCPQPLEGLARGIVRKCGGLPPAINSVSRLLRAKENDLNEWNKVCNSFRYYLATNDQLSGIRQILLQNYYDLPYYLKPCFLYFGLFPQRRSISRMRLIRLWIAEGFIGETTSNLTLEEVGEEYMNELINMGMIEVKSRDLSGKVRSLGLLSEILDVMILWKFEELNFCYLLSKKDCVGNETSRRMSIHKNHNANALDFLDYRKSSIRSLFVFEVGSELMLKLSTKAFFKSINLLKVLDLFNAPLDEIPEEVGTLRNLRYLSLRCTRVSTLPNSIGKLENLLTLDLKQTFISQLPLKINNLTKLRHILGYNYELDLGFSAHCLKINGMSTPEGLLGKCLELQHLGFLDLGHRNWATELRNLTQLRKLGIVGLKSEEGEALCSIIDGMKYLQTLNIFSCTKSENINLANVSSPPLMLKRLYLNGPLVSLPTWVSETHNLVKIQLRWSNLVGDPLETLELLPNLVELQLLEAFVGGELKISSHGFQKLKKLSLLDLHSLRSFSMAQGALPLLEEMSIGESKNLELPSGIKYLDSLKTLNFYNMPSDFCNRIRPGDSDYSIVRHVSTVVCHIKHPIYR